MNKRQRFCCSGQNEVSSCYEEARTSFHCAPVCTCSVSYPAALNIPAGDRSTFAEVVDIIAAFMEDQRAARGCDAPSDPLSTLF